MTRATTHAGLLQPTRLLRDCSHRVALLAFLLTAWSVCTATTVKDLRCESLKDPLGIDVLQPRLSWVMESPARGQYQTASRILVASSAAKLRANDGDLWDTGKRESRESIQVMYEGQPLASHTECFWKVRIWDKDGRASAWSKPAYWSMGMLETSDWTGIWIGQDEPALETALSKSQWIWFPEGEPQVAAPAERRFFRRAFEIPADRVLQEAQLLITADNECTIHLNGAEIGTHSGFSVVKAFDLKAQLQPGRNLLAVMALNRGTRPNPAALVARLRAEFEGDETFTLATDASWKAMNRQLTDWIEPTFDDSDWPAAKELGRVGMQPWGEVGQPADRRLPARYLRKEFALDKRIKRATVHYSGLGVSELYLNGRKVGDSVLSPGLTEYGKRVFYVTFDVTDQLRRGPNALGVILGNGRYYSPRGGKPNYGWPKLLFNLRIEYTDGSLARLVSDGSWKLSTDGPIRANNEFDGEEYEARWEFKGWAKPDFDDSAWPPVQQVEAPGGKLAAQIMEPIRVTQTLKPVAMSEPEPGVYIFDMGQNMVGWCRIKVRGSEGTQITLRHAETLRTDGTLYVANLRSAKATDVYTLSGRGTETWEPRFTYHGFRYVEVRGWPGKPALNAIEGRVVHDDLRRTGDFTCSNPLLNQIHRNIVWGLRGNYRSIPTDCPQRDERQGWLGDRSEGSRGEMYLFDAAAFYSKWMQDITDGQKESGSISDVCPTYWQNYSDNVTWPSSAILIPNSLLRQYGDKRIIARQYESMKRWVDYMQGFVADGLISRDSYGDWCVPPEDPGLIHSKDPGRITDKTLLASSYFYHDLRLMESYAELVGEGADARHFRQLADEMKVAFNDRFLSRKLGRYDNGTQTSSVLPLHFGLVPDDMQDEVFHNLVTNIVVRTKGHIGTGLVGAQFLNRVLSDNDRADLAYTMASQPDYPGWGYMVNQGATTIWELWNGDTADPSMNSGNHVMLIGDLAIWLYEYLAGIRPDDARPGFQHILMQPHPVGDLDHVKASHRSPYGWIRSEWKRSGEQFDWKIEIPANTKATVHVPASKLERVTESGKAIGKARGVNVLRMEDGQAVLQVGSGKYRFKSSRRPTDQPGVVGSEFIFETAPYPSCHASTIEETKSGLVAAWFGGTHERNPDVGIWVSRHEKGRWTTPVEVANGVESSTTRYPTWNPVLFQAQDGPLMLFYKVGPNPREWWGMVMTSDDEGRTWSNGERLPNGIIGPIKNKPVRLANGDILSPCSTEQDGWQAHFERSADGGKTWVATPSVNDPAKIRAIQPSILSYSDGRLQALGRTRYSGIFSIWSEDNGRTWGDMDVVNLPNPSSGTDAVTLQDGRQLLVYNHNTREATTNKGRSPLNLAISEDGIHWQAALVLENRPDAPSGFAYPAVIQTRDGLVHITYTWQRERIQHVVIDPAQLILKPMPNGQWPD